MRCIRYIDTYCVLVYYRDAEEKHFRQIGGSTNYTHETKSILAKNYYATEAFNPGEVTTRRLYITLTCIISYHYSSHSMVNRVEPPIVDPPTKGHNIIIDLSTKDTGQICFPIVLIHLEPPTKGQPLYKGHNS